MDYSRLVAVYGELDKTRSRLEMTSIVASFLTEVPEEDLPHMMLFLSGRVFPMWSEKELGIGYKLVVKAVSTISGAPETLVEDAVRETGDIGLAAEKLMAKKTQTTLYTEKLTAGKVYSNLEKMASLAGKGSQDKKIAHITELLSFANPLESRYIVRMILEEMRLGVGDGIIRDALAEAFNVDPRLVERAYHLTSDYGEVAKAAKKEGDKGLGKIDIRPGRPIWSMLAQKIKDIRAALEEFSPAAFEIKYDGARMQVHKTPVRVELYTRRLEKVTRQFPEMVAAARENITAESAIVEGEMVAIKSLADRTPRPFQELSRRIKRKYDIKETVEKIPVEMNLFDIVYLEGKNVTGEPFSKRRKILEGIVNETRTFRLAEQLVTGDAKEAEEFYKKALDSGHEGVMAKNPFSPYQPGSRVGYMYKIKPVMETLDLVITGATWGEGRRAHWLGSYLLSARDPDTGELLEIGRMATGFTDEQLKDMTETLKPDIIKETGKEVALKPRIVVEVAYEEIQKSPTYGSGYALRFPRLVRVRTDKGPEDADSLQRVEDILRK
ncbi:MAG: ATP-dependent DNA ligase [Candidatus Altiarchaeota archaeon]|nr:ATP-dependent DNA ligase [Candidatus Altiarchaeota archaeon]